jgi:hypothetical protein
MAAVPKTFADDFELWAESLLEDGDTPEGIYQIRQAIREALANGGEAAAYWAQRVADEAKYIRSCQRQLLAASTEPQS